MIIRRSLIRQNRLLRTSLLGTYTRSFASEVDTLEAAVGNSLKETQSIESLIQEHATTPVPRIDGTTHRTFDWKTDQTVRKYLAVQHQKQTSGRYGTDIAPHYQPHQLLSNPPSPSQITLELLLASQSHLGHSTSLWNPMNSRYIFGIRQGIHIISLDVTASHLRRACRVVSGVAQRAGLILFVGTRPGQDRCVVNAAKLVGGCHLFGRWIPGSITNGNQILGLCAKKVVDEHDNEVPGHDERLGDMPALRPDLVVCLNPLENWVMLHECALNDIPTIGIIDTDADPTWVTYPIPANDDSLRCVQVIAGVLGKAGEEGLMRRRESAKQGVITFNPVEDLGGNEEEEEEEDDDDDGDDDDTDQLMVELLSLDKENDHLFENDEAPVEEKDMEEEDEEDVDEEEKDKEES